MAGDLNILANLRDHRLALRFQIRISFGRITLGYVVAERAERVVASHKVRLAVHFHQHAELAAGRDVLGDRAFLRIAGRFGASSKSRAFLRR